MKNFIHFCYTITFSLYFISSITAKTFTSVQSGNWTNNITWDKEGTPGKYDDVVISAGHTVTILSGNYKHSADITIEEAGMLIANTLKFDGYEFHVYGELDISGTNRNLVMEWFSLFWVHSTAIITISGDLKLKEYSSTVIDETCVNVSDDIIITGLYATLCGSGGISLGTNTFQNKVQLNGGASSAQICTGTEISRGTGGNCTTLVLTGIGNYEPVAVDDIGETEINTSISIDVLFSGTPDSDLDGDDLWLWSVGTDGNNGSTDNGGTVSINYNGTWWNPGDDLIDYTPPTGFIGIDYFQYVVTDFYGGFTTATVEVEIKVLLPVTLVSFSGIEEDCKIVLNWSTSSEENNDYFVIEKSTDGRSFYSIGEVDGRGTTDEFQYYEFIDKTPSSMNYYRLAQVDYDEKSTSSNIIAVENKCLSKKTELEITSLFPNPAIGSDITVEVSNTTNQEKEIIVMDAFGLIVYKTSWYLSNGKNKKLIDITAIPTGTYFLKIGNEVKKFVKISKN